MKRSQTRRHLPLLALVLSSFTSDALALNLYAVAPGSGPAVAAPSGNAGPRTKPPAGATVGPNVGPGAGTIAGSGACEREIQAAAAKYAIPEGILYSVGLTETGRKGSLSAFAMNVEGKAYFHESRQEAMVTFDNARRQGAKLIDIGCMQINHHFHGENFASAEQMFDPKLNVEYAAKFLRSLHDKHETWTMTVARYHAGPNNDPAQKRYVCRVISNLVATGYGKWTPNASGFCNAPTISN